MSTRLEQIQAAVKAAQASGQKIFDTPVNAPQMATTQTVKAPTPSVGVAATVQPPTIQGTVNTAANPSKSASSVSPQMQAEIQRKASAGIALTNPTAASTAAYNAAKSPSVQAPTAAAKPSVQPNTNYVANGGKTLNDILYLKDNYRPDNKNYTASQAAPLYSQLDQKTAAMVKGMSADQLRNYINGLGTQRTATTQNTQNEGMQFEQVDPYALTLEQLKAQAQAESAAKMASLQSAYEATEKNIRGRYDYERANTKDNRSLEDASFYRNNAPAAWDGSQGYRGAQIDRNRSIADTYTGMALQDSLASAYAPVSDYANQQQDLINARTNELTQQERQYGLNVADRTGLLNGQQTMQGAANAASTAGQLISNQGQLLSNQGQQIANQIAKINLDNYPAQVKLQLQQLQQQINSGAISNATAQYQFQELTNPNSVTNQVAALDLQMKQIDASNYSESQKLQLEQLKKTVAQIGKVEPVSAYEQQMQQLDLQKAQLQIQQLTAEASPSQMTAEDYATNYIDKSVQRDKKGVITNLPQVQAQILQSGLPDAEIAKLYVRYGIPLPQGYSGN